MFSVLKQFVQEVCMPKLNFNSHYSDLKITVFNSFSKTYSRSIKPYATCTYMHSKPVFYKF